LANRRFPPVHGSKTMLKALHEAMSEPKGPDRLDEKDNAKAKK
jgi:hypothetical protein